MRHTIDGDRLHATITFFRVRRTKFGIFVSLSFDLRAIRSIDADAFFRHETAFQVFVIDKSSAFPVVCIKVHKSAVQFVSSIDFYSVHISEFNAKVFDTYPNAFPMRNHANSLVSAKSSAPSDIASRERITPAPHTLARCLWAWNKTHRKASPVDISRNDLVS